MLGLFNKIKNQAQKIECRFPHGIVNRNLSIINLYHFFELYRLGGFHEESHIVGYLFYLKLCSCRK